MCKPEEFEQFIASLKTDLPATFRITGSKCVSHKMLQIVENELIKNCVDVSQVGCPEKSLSIFPIPWYVLHFYLMCEFNFKLIRKFRYPNKLAWQMELSRKDIRRCEAYYKLHNFLISETENGTISRQETVSMIPPLLLDVQPYHKVSYICIS